MQINLFTKSCPSKLGVWLICEAILFSFSIVQSDAWSVSYKHYTNKVGGVMQNAMEKLWQMKNELSANIRKRSITCQSWWLSCFLFCYLSANYEVFFFLFWCNFCWDLCSTQIPERFRAENHVIGYAIISRDNSELIRRKDKFKLTFIWKTVQCHSYSWKWQILVVWRVFSSFMCLHKEWVS